MVLAAIALSSFVFSPNPTQWISIEVGMSSLEASQRDIQIEIRNGADDGRIVITMTQKNGCTVPH